jgi:hypothetical protein
MKIIGIAGLKRSGKDTIANFFVESERFTKVALADSLKELLVRVFGVEKKYFYDDALKEGDLPERITIDYSHLDKLCDIVKNEWGFPIEQRDRIDYFFGQEISSVRSLLQTVGNDILRDCIRDDIFIVLLFCRIKEISGNVVISDVRYKNERDALKKAGASLLLVKRNPLMNKDQHTSENSLGKDKEYDVIITNDDISLNQLRSEVLMWYSVKAKYK